MIILDKIKEFEIEREERIRSYKNNKELYNAGLKFMENSFVPKYSYNFSWLGMPIIQYPQDIVAMQEIIWEIKPDLIIETGVARGGSIIFYASMLELLGKGEVVGIDIEIRPHNRKAIELHKMNERISLIEGSSISEEVIEQVKKKAKSKACVLVCLDSNHMHNHVLKELKLYSTLVTKGSYLVVFDTIIEKLPERFFDNRPWGKGNNPMSAVDEFLKFNDCFVIDEQISNKLVISVAINGFLKRIK